MEADNSQTVRKDVDADYGVSVEDFSNNLASLAGRTNVRLKRSTAYILAAVDGLALILAIVIGKYCYWLFSDKPVPRQLLLDSGSTWSRQSYLYFGLVLITLAWFWSARHYSKRSPLWNELREILKIILLVGALDAALIFLAKWPVSRLWLGMTWALALMLVPTLRIATKKILILAGGWRRPTVIVGTGPNARRAAEALLSEKFMGYDVLAFIAGPSRSLGGPVTINIANRKLPVLYYSSRFWELLRQLNSPHLVIALEYGEEDEQHAIMRGIQDGYRNVHVAPPVTGLPLYGTEVHHFFRHEVLLLNIRNNLDRIWSRSIKRMFDIFGSIIGLLVLSPVLLIIAVLITSDGGKILFGHARIGKRGKHFKCLKFRTMVPNADEVLDKLLSEDELARKEWADGYKLKSDPRVTFIGKFLRRTSLDELPQLWNVLIGEMSLVGPRPIIEQEMAKYGDDIRLYFGTRPGITGLWQVSGRSNSDYDSRVALDCWYIRNWSLWYDIYILLKTVAVVIRRDGAY